MVKLFCDICESEVERLESYTYFVEPSRSRYDGFGQIPMLAYSENGEKVIKRNQEHLCARCSEIAKGISVSELRRNAIISAIKEGAE